MDTVTKRFSMMTFSSGLDFPLPWADALTTKGERQTFLSLYSGNDLSARATVASTDPDPGILYWGGSSRPRSIRT